MQSSLPNSLIVMSGNKNNRQLRTQQVDPPLQLEAIHAGHPDVRNQTMGCCDFFRLQKFLGRGVQKSCVPGGFQQALERLSQTKVIIYADHNWSAFLVDRTLHLRDRKSTRLNS